MNMRVGNYSLIYTLTGLILKPYCSSIPSGKATMALASDSSSLVDETKGPKWRCLFAIGINPPLGKLCELENVGRGGNEASVLSSSTWRICG